MDSDQSSNEEDSYSRRTAQSGRTQPGGIDLNAYYAYQQQMKQQQQLARGSRGGNNIDEDSDGDGNAIPRNTAPPLFTSSGSGIQNQVNLALGKSCKTSLQSSY